MSSAPQIRLEKLLIIFNKLQRAKIFPYDELKAIIGKIRDYEYQIQRNSVTKFEYLRYVAYLTELQDYLKQERSRFNHLLQFKNVSAKINLHIKSLLWKAIQRDQHDIKLWFDYIEFCKRSCRMEDVSKTFVAMLQIHPDKEDAWISAAKYHFEIMRSPNVSRNLLQTGIRDHPESIKLWKEYFKFELLNADMVWKRMEILKRDLTEDDNLQNISKVKPEMDVNDAVISGKIAVVIFKNAIPLITKDLSLAMVFLNITNTFEPVLRVPVKKEMIKIMEENFPDEEQTFDFKAHCFSDKYFTCNYLGVSEDKFDSIDDCKCDQLTESVYREGISAKPTTIMWNYFLSFHLKSFSRSSSDSEEIQARKLDNLLLVFDECWRTDLMSRHAFLEWILALEIKDDWEQIDKLMVKGCQKWSKYADIWFLRLTLMAKRINFKEELKRLFTRAIKEIDYKATNKAEEKRDLTGLRVRKMKKKTISNIWTFYLDWSSKHLHPTEVLKFIEIQFLELLTKGGGNLIIQRELSALLKPELLRKSIELKKDGLKSARSYYEKYKNHPPVVESFFQQMITIEKDQTPTIDTGRVTAIYEDLIHNFGETDHSIWLDYCKFLYEGSKPHTAGQIYHRACKTLTPNEVTNFVAGYNLLQNAAL